ncbi:hypothetical protein PRIPAC_83310 [Pristionchus pacificus]|uniref:Uncharacterized protein n=1 Tax=Pristionchus pacificus TaxID=54126 RepID=A0A2A6BV83_PRIPA|nr:hypothetical protein PRIPAC_83310 [Pristionchus pacificus]|eukprot:PDM69671.1 hypothetical protein PRIPAC_44767 [Pristionchus pacificus]
MQLVFAFALFSALCLWEVDSRRPIVSGHWRQYELSDPRWNYDGSLSFEKSDGTWMRVHPRGRISVKDLLGEYERRNIEARADPHIYTQTSPEVADIEVKQDDSGVIDQKIAAEDIDE